MKKLSLYDTVQLSLLAITLVLLLIAGMTWIVGPDNFLQNNAFITLTMIVLITLWLLNIAVKSLKTEIPEDNDQ